MFSAAPPASTTAGSGAAGAATTDPGNDDEGEEDDARCPPWLTPHFKSHARLVFKWFGDATALVRVEAALSSLPTREEEEVVGAEKERGEGGKRGGATVVAVA